MILPFCLHTGWKLWWLHQTPGHPAGTQQGRLQDLYEQSYCGILQKRSDRNWESKAVTNGDNKKSGNVESARSHSRVYWNLPTAFFVSFLSSGLPSFLGLHVNRRHWRARWCRKQLTALQSSHYSLPHAPVFRGNLHRREAVPVSGTIWYVFKSSTQFLSRHFRLVTNKQAFVGGRDLRSGLPVQSHVSKLFPWWMMIHSPSLDFRFFRS